MTRALKKTQNILIWSSNQKYVGVINDAFFLLLYGATSNFWSEFVTDMA